MRIKFKGFFLIAILLSTQTVFSQYRTSFNIQDNSIKVVLFEAQQVSLITIATSKESIFNFSSASEGSYKNDLYFDYEVSSDTLIIKSIYPKKLEFGDNKMTSMQEFSVSVKLTMPNNLKLIIDSEIASIEGSGNFRNLYINTKSGNCKLTNFVGNANINSFDGRIYIETKQAKVQAKSQKGDIDISSALVENYLLNLRTVNGNIEVIQLK
jgi:DUF4097 and DUF4098 domain-containing protein YvlB